MVEVVTGSRSAAGIKDRIRKSEPTSFFGHFYPIAHAVCSGCELGCVLVDCGIDWDSIPIHCQFQTCVILAALDRIRIAKGGGMEKIDRDGVWRLRHFALVLLTMVLLSLALRVVAAESVQFLLVLVAKQIGVMACEVASCCSGGQFSKWRRYVLPHCPFE